MVQGEMVRIFEYDVDGKVPVTSTALQETPGLVQAIIMCPGDFKPAATVEVREANNEEKRIGDIALADLRLSLGMEVELAQRDRKILNDPHTNTALGMDMSYVTDRVRYGYGISSAMKKMVGKLF